MPRATAACTVIAIALGSVSLAGCFVNDDPQKPDKPGARSRASARCAGYECRVRVTCKGHVSVLLGPAPVDVRTRRTLLQTTIVADFAGSKDDRVVRC
jgi:hypothetical protein